MVGMMLSGIFTGCALIDGVIDIPARQVIGTDFIIVASGQGERDGYAL